MYEKSCASSNHIKSWKDIDFGTAEYSYYEHTRWI